ncbi:MAG: alpha/beta fold hydrolase [Verrucomicrobiales bacterium]|nr:alpha/beta fold hydrolase [Verrucomicrobiales bacterium]
MRPFRVAAALALLLLVGAGCRSLSNPQRAGPWPPEQLAEVPQATWGATNGLVQELYYEGVPLNGRSTRVYALLGRPAGDVREKSPAVLLVHGGGGKAFREWAEHWARRGYVALAMDLSGNGPTGRLEDGGPDQSDAVKFREFDTQGIPDMWTYHAVAAVIRGHSLLRTLPGVDSRRIGVTGISWGGYLTCIIAGLDPRLRVAVPVYGCGYLGDNSVWTDKSLAAMSEKARKLWLEVFDPSRYLENVGCPILFLNGTTDFAYPLDSYRKSYRLVPEPLRYVAVVPDLPHGHIWTFAEVDTFIDSALNGGVRSPRLGASELVGNQIGASVVSALPITEAMLCYTLDSGPWQKRKWNSIPARVDGQRVLATMPTAQPTAAFLAVKDTRGIRASSEHLEWDGESRPR